MLLTHWIGKSITVFMNVVICNGVVSTMNFTVIVQLYYSDSRHSSSSYFCFLFSNCLACFIGLSFKIRYFMTDLNLTHAKTADFKYKIRRILEICNIQNERPPPVKDDNPPYFTFSGFLQPVYLLCCAIKMSRYIHLYSLCF